MSNDISVQSTAFFSFTYGLFVLTAKGENDNGCIINTAQQVTSEPNRIAITVNKHNFTHDLIARGGIFNVSLLSQDVPFEVFSHFGFQSGRVVNKFADFAFTNRSNNGLLYLNKFANAFVSAKVIESIDLGTHTMFIGDVCEAKTLSDTPSVTYAYYFAHIKPKPQPKTSSARVWVCRICGYEYNEAVEKVPFEQLPADWTCPLCLHPKSDFELKK